MICYRCRGYGVLELNIDFEGFAYHNMYYLMKKEKRNKVCRQILSDKRNVNRETVQIFRTEGKNIPLAGFRLQCSIAACRI